MRVLLASTTSEPLRASLDHLEQVLLQMEPLSAVGLDTAELQRCLEIVAGHFENGRAPAASRLTPRLLDLAISLARGEVRSTSAVLDTLHRAVDCLRAFDDAAPGAGQHAELEDLLVEVQALAGAAAGRGAGRSDVAAPTALASTQGSDDLPGQAALDALFATLGPLVNAQVSLVQAARAQAGPLSLGLERAASRVDDCVRDTAQRLTEWRSACGASPPAGPELVEVIAVRAAASICLLPASAVLGVARVVPDEEAEPGPQGSAAPAPEAGAGKPIDLRRWLTASAEGSGAEKDAVPTPSLALTVWTGAGQRVWLADEMLFQRTVAVQPLETHFRSVPGVAGVAVLGEMGVCLLLDTGAGPLTAGPETAPADHAVPAS